MFLYGNSHWRVELKWLTGWSNEILRAIRCKEEGRIYRDAGLIEKRVNGRPALVNPAIDGRAFNCRKDWLKEKLADYDRWKDYNNADLMGEGYPPRDSNGDPYELHHIGQQQDSPFAELTWQQHRGDGNYAILHPQRESEIDHQQFDHEKAAHWMARFEDFKNCYTEMNLQELVHRVSFEEVWPILTQLSEWAADEMIYYRIGYDLAQVVEGEPSDIPIVISREEDPHNGTCYIDGSDCEGHWLEQNLLREIRLDGALQLSEAEIVAVILINTSYLAPRRDPWHKPLPNQYQDKLEEMTQQDIRFYSHLSPHKYRMAVRRDSESVIEALRRNFLRCNRAKRMRCHRRELLREKYERLRNTQECINHLVRVHCGVSEQEWQYLFDAKEIMIHDIDSARCAENERVEYLLDILQRHGDEMYKHCDSIVFLFTTDASLPLTDYERSLAEGFLDRLAPWKRALVLNERIDGFGPYINLHITGSCAR